MLLAIFLSFWNPTNQPTQEPAIFASGFDLGGSLLIFMHLATFRALAPGFAMVEIWWISGMMVFKGFWLVGGWTSPTHLKIFVKSETLKPQVLGVTNKNIDQNLVDDFTPKMWPSSKMWGLRMRMFDLSTSFQGVLPGSWHHVIV